MRPGTSGAGARGRGDRRPRARELDAARVARGARERAARRRGRRCGHGTRAERRRAREQSARRRAHAAPAAGAQVRLPLILRLTLCRRLCIRLLASFSNVSFQRPFRTCK